VQKGKIEMAQGEGDSQEKTSTFEAEKRCRELKRDLKRNGGYEQASIKRHSRGGATEVRDSRNRT